jgi:hypothetical protein
MMEEAEEKNALDGEGERNRRDKKSRRGANSK